MSFKNKISQKIFLPVLVIVGLMLLWEIIVILNDIPAYILPRPSFIIETLIIDWPILYPSMLNTIEITLGGFAIATVGGVAIAIVFSLSKTIENALFPIAVIIQVTPIIAISPIILIYANSTETALLICAWLVAFFPVLSNTIFGLTSVETNLVELFKLQNANKIQTLYYLRIPYALPNILSGIRIAGGLSLIGAIVAEFTAGTAGVGSGLAFRILESGYRLNIPRMFAALFLIAIIGITIYLIITYITYLLLRKWHSSYQN